MSYTRKSIFACAPATTRGQAVQLGSDPKGQNFLYTNGKSVIIRNIANPEIATEYTQHSAPTTVARYSPSGYYIASGDVHGNVRIWDTIQAEQILKNEVKVIAGRINDIAWDSESKRIIAVGDGKERHGHAFMFDTGSSAGEISSHFKVINSVSIRQQRPFRAATGSDDFTVVFYHGAPYKYNLTIKDHTGFVQSVKFSPDGEKLVTAGSDKKIFLYEGKTGSKLTDLSEAAGENAHSGGVYAVSWSPDSKQLLTSSGDKTAKIWDIETQKVVQTFEFSESVDDLQIGNLWQGEHLISLSLSGDINYLSQNSPSPVRVVKYNLSLIVIHMCGPVKKEDKMISIGMDDTLRIVDVESKSFRSSIVPTGSLPKSLAASKDGKIFLATLKDVQIIKDERSVYSVSVPSPPGAIALNPAGTEIVVGCEDTKVRIYKVKGDELEEENEQLTGNKGAITAITYSPDGSLLAVGDSQGKILAYDAKSKKNKDFYWNLHNARINSIAWSPDSLHAVSGSLDTNIYIWSVEKPMKSIAIKGAHQINVNGVSFRDNNTVVSVGQDACVKSWTIQHH
ncbi:6591_t:CDS:10 [Acaulospora morrowiae]|uniref:6591_t:CDS:1 n=1 Tax=Acaulospora morrowiae TaxID=94023 RepID=A0A9N9DF86_9GLOM|nr:6591_t:CDS:10 [Acaulospora morrowiae]